MVLGTLAFVLGAGAGYVLYVRQGQVTQILIPLFANRSSTSTRLYAALIAEACAGPRVAKLVNGLRRQMGHRRPDGAREQRRIVHGVSATSCCRFFQFGNLQGYSFCLRRSGSLSLIYLHGLQHDVEALSHAFNRDRPRNPHHASAARSLLLVRTRAQAPLTSLLAAIIQAVDRAASCCADYTTKPARSSRIPPDGPSRPSHTVVSDLNIQFSTADGLSLSLMLALLTASRHARCRVGHAAGRKTTERIFYACTAASSPQAALGAFASARTSSSSTPSTNWRSSRPSCIIAHAGAPASGTRTGVEDHDLSRPRQLHPAASG